VFYKIDFVACKFKSFSLKPKFNLWKQVIFFLEFFNTFINHITQISLINITLKWHYINLFEIIDSFLVVWHGFWLIWLWFYLLKVVVPRHSHFTRFFPIPNALPSGRLHGLTHPQLLKRLKSESQTENNERAKSQGTLPGSQHYKEGRGACQSSGMGLGRNDKLQSLTQTCTKPTQNG
jgi:hypothetical protein